MNTTYLINLIKMSNISIEIGIEGSATIALDALCIYDPQDKTCTRLLTQDEKEALPLEELVQLIYDGNWYVDFSQVSPANVCLQSDTIYGIDGVELDLIGSES